MGNGHPLAATIIKRNLVEKFAKKTGYFNTFGGNAVSCAAGMAVMDVIEQDNLQENALNIGKYLKEEIKSLANKYDLIGDVRGKGLFIAVEMISDCDMTPASEAASSIVQQLKESGVLTNTIGPYSNILKLRPPMIFSRENSDYFLDRFDSILKKNCANYFNANKN